MVYSCQCSFIHDKNSQRIFIDEKVFDTKEDICEPTMCPLCVATVVCQKMTVFLFIELSPQERMLFNFSTTLTSYTSGKLSGNKVSMSYPNVL